MELQLESTDEIVEVDGVPCRLWVGITAGGVPVNAFIHRLAVHNDSDCKQFEAELLEQRPPNNLGVLEPILDQIWDRR